LIGVKPDLQQQCHHQAIDFSYTTKFAQNLEFFCKLRCFVIDSIREEK